VTGTSDSLDARRRRAIFRATHRGTREMDWLLGRFVEARAPSWGEPELERIEQLIAVPDPDLNAWILDPATVTLGEFLPLIDEIRRFHDLTDATAAG
jgi:antitoxin CptB